MAQFAYAIRRLMTVSDIGANRVIIKRQIHAAARPGTLRGPGDPFEPVAFVASGARL